MKTSERDIQKQILAWLNIHPHVRVWRQNTGATKIGSRFLRFGHTGQADITGILRGGRRLEIEVKAEGGRVSPEQAEFGRMVEEFGGLYILAYSLDDVMERLLES